MTTQLYVSARELRKCFTKLMISILLVLVAPITGPFPAILGKGLWPKLGKMIDLSLQLGEINDIEP